MSEAPIATKLKLDERRLGAEVFERIDARAGIVRERRAKAELGWESFGKPGRDPATLGSVAGVIAAAGKWVPHLKIAQLNNNWDQVVGPGVAAHSTVASFTDGVLTIRADSQVWATQLTYLIPQLTAVIREKLAGLDIEEIRVMGGAASGPRTTRRWVRR